MPYKWRKCGLQLGFFIFVFFNYYYFFNSRVSDKISGILSHLKRKVNILVNLPIAKSPTVFSRATFPLIISGFFYEIEQGHCAPPLRLAPCSHNEIIRNDTDTWNKYSKLVLWLSPWWRDTVTPETVLQLIGSWLEWCLYVRFRLLRKSSSLVPFRIAQKLNITVKN